MIERGKPTPKVVVAMARELVGYLWARCNAPLRRAQLKHRG